MPPQLVRLPQPRGRLFVITLQLAEDLHATLQSITGSGFLGGLLHGAVGSRWFGLVDPARGLSWRILAPPLQVAAGRGPGRGTSTAHRLRFGVLVHGGHGQQWHEAQQSLMSLTDLGVGSLRVPVLSVHVLHQALPMSSPPLPPPPLAKAQAELDNKTPQPAALALRWTTPLHLASRAKVQAGHGGAPPTLLAVVRSLRRRACLLEPDWAQALDLNGSAWVAVEESLRQADAAGAQATRSRMQVVAWRYGSRTKATPFMRHGLMGSQVFVAPMPPSLQTLLSLGAWLGIGEGASFGCGQYRWRVRLPGGESATALLPQPWSGGRGLLLI